MGQNELQTLIGARILRFRKDFGWSQSELSRKSGVKASSISSLEAGKINPTIYTLIKIAKGLRVSVSELFDGECEPLTDVETFYKRFREIRAMSADDQNLIERFIGRLSRPDIPNTGAIVKKSL